MAITTREKRGRLEDAAALSVFSGSPTPLRAKLRALETLARSAISGGAVKSASGNGHTVEFFGYGQGQITPLEVAELYRTLVDLYDDSATFLRQCATYGLDAFQILLTMFPNGVTVVSPANVIDTTGRWAIYLAQFGITSTDVIGTTVNDKAIFTWMMYNLVAVTETKSDFSGLRTAVGGGFV